MTGSTTPLILVVSGDEGVRQQLVRDIARRFGADYWVAAEPTTDAALGRLESQVAAGAGTALVIVDERLANPPPADFLLRVHQLQPQAKRILLIKRGNWSSGHPVMLGNGARPDRLPPVRSLGTGGADSLSQHQ